MSPFIPRFLASVTFYVPISIGYTQLDLSVPEPMAPQVPHTRSIHGEDFKDPYFWLRYKKDPKVIAYLRSEEAYANKVMAPTKPAQDRLYRELVGRIKETDLEVPVFEDGYWYYTKTIKGKQYPVYVRRKTMKSAEQVILDVNMLAKGKPFLSVSDVEVSPNGHLLAYTVDETGYREYQLKFKDLRSGKLLPDRFGKVTSVTWANDNKTVYFTSEDSSKRPDKLWRRRLGSKSAELIRSEPVRQYNLYAYPSRDKKYLFCISESAETTEGWFLSLDSPSSKLRLISARNGKHRYYPEHRNGRFYIQTNLGAKEFKVVTTDVDSPGTSHWTTLLPGRDGLIVRGIEVYKNWLVVEADEGALQVLKAFNFTTKNWHEVKFKEQTYSMNSMGNPEYDSHVIRINYSSFVTPRLVYDYDLSTRKLQVKKQQEVPGYKSSEYETRFLWATARDGVKVPISIAYKKSMPPSQERPMLLEAYGAYGSPNRPSWASTNVALMNRGITVATAHVRGGGELGDRWHDDGKMENKVNTFTDFIDCADWLVSQGITSHQKLAITGGSAGGLTMGAVLNLRPDVAKVALVYVPFVDVINTMLDESIPLTTQEFLEWGNPKVEKEYGWIRAYSPYDNVGPMAYPAMLIRTSLNDSQVPYWEPAKWTASLRAHRTSKEPLLFKINMDAGHGGSSGRYDALRDMAFDITFLFECLGVK